MTLLEFEKEYCFHDSYIESMKYNEDTAVLSLIINFAFWMQENYVEGEEETGLIKVDFSHVTDYTCEGDPAGRFVGILDGVVSGDSFVFRLLDDMSNQYMELTVHATGVDVKRIQYDHQQSNPTEKKYKKDEYEYLWTTEKNDWVLVNTAFEPAIVNKTEQAILHVDDEALERALTERMRSAGCRIYDDIRNAYNDVPGGPMYGDDVFLCEKCGHEMRSFRHGHECGMTCTNCGWGWVSSYFEQYETDPVAYHISLCAPSEASMTAIKLIAEIATCNYMEAKKLIEAAPTEVFCGQAIDIMKVRERLKDAGIRFEIKPDFPY